MLVHEFLAKNKTVIMPQPPYSLNLAPFPPHKTEHTGKVKEKHFVMTEDIKRKSKQKLLAIPKIAFYKCFEDWKKCWHKCIISEGGYFEGQGRYLVVNK